MPEKKITRAGKNLIEIFMALVLVFLFFGVLLVIMNYVFPVSGGLGLILGEREGTKTIREADGDQEKNSLNSTTSLHATLSMVYQTVKSKKSTNIAWQEAKKGLMLFDRDAVQTFTRSSAEVVFDESNRLTLGENSLIVINLFEEDTVLKEKRSFLVMVDGEFRGKLGGSGGVPVRMEIAAPGGKIRIAAEPGGGETDFRLRVNPDKSSTLSVMKGEVEMIAGEEVLALRKNETAILGPGEKLGEVRSLPETPKTLSPADGESYFSRELPPKIHFSWHAEEGGETRFQLARDGAFMDILVDDRTDDGHFTHGNLREGRYYWRLSRVEGYYESDYSQPLSFRVIRDRKGPLLNVSFPGGSLTEKQLVLEGTTDPGAAVFSGQVKAVADQAGRFTLVLELRQGINVIVVEAVDKAGNSAYRSSTVNVKL